jgi:hypothetical protein
MAEVGAVLQHCRAAFGRSRANDSDAADRAIAPPSVLNGLCEDVLFETTTPQHMLLLLERTWVLIESRCRLDDRSISARSKV